MSDLREGRRAACASEPQVTELSVEQLEEVYGGRFGTNGLAGLTPDRRNMLLQWGADELHAATRR